MSSHTQDRWATTHWSLVMRQAAGESADASRALSELGVRYWYPVYAYIRHCGHAPAAATKIAHRFMQRLLSEVSDPASSPSHGHYRHYLLSRLHAFLAAGQDDHGSTGDALELPADLESRYQRDHVDQHSPEQSFQRAFALQVIDRTLRRLRDEARLAGHIRMYELLEPYLAHDPVPGEYAVIADALHSRPLTAVVALKRLRQRFRELAAEEMADTVASASELAAEQDALLNVMSSPPP